MSQLNIQQIEKLIKQYYESASELLKYTDKHWDAMYSDIQGYYGALNEEPKYIDINQLKRQINSVNMLTEAFKSLNYIYG
jgi:hypothetical protein